MCFLVILLLVPACTPPLLPPLSYGQYNFSLHLGEASLAHLLPSHAHSPDPHPACHPDGVDLWHSGGTTFEYSIWGDHKIRASPAALMVKNLPAMRETQVRSLGQEDPLKKGMATHSSILAWRIPWTEEPGGLQSMGSWRAGHDWATNSFTLFQDQSQRKPTFHYKSSEAGLHTLLPWFLAPQSIRSGGPSRWISGSGTNAQDQRRACAASLRAPGHGKSHQWQRLHGSDNGPGGPH